MSECPAGFDEVQSVTIYYFKDEKTGYGELVESQKDLPAHQTPFEHIWKTCYYLKNTVIQI